MKSFFMKVSITLSLILIVITVPVLIISTPVQIYSHSINLYRAGFEKYDISLKTGINSQQLQQVAQQMIGYFNGSADTPQVVVTVNGTDRPLYNEKELFHLEDVCNILRLFTRLLVASIILFIAVVIYLYLSRKLYELLKAVQVGAIITSALTGALIVWAIIDFNSLFLLFHYVSFSNDLWILDPAKDYLIMLFPEGFFNDAAIMIVMTVLIEAVIIWIAAFFIRKLYSKDKLEFDKTRLPADN